MRNSKQNNNQKKTKKEKRRKLERQNTRENSEVVRFERAPPEKVTKHSRIVRASIHCTTTTTPITNGGRAEKSLVPNTKTRLFRINKK